MRKKDFYCHICKETFYCVPGHHIRKHNISPRNYFDTYCKLPGDGKCLQCGNDTRFNGLITGYSTFCSNPVCANSHPSVREKIKNTNLKKYGTEAPAQNITVANKVAQNQKKQWNQNKNERLIKCKKTRQERWGDENYNNRSLAKETYIKNIESGATHTNYSKSSQKLFWMIYDKIKTEFKEVYFAELKTGSVERTNYEFIVNTPMGMSVRFLDFYIKDINVNIEFGYDYFHSKEKDDKRQREIELTLPGIKTLKIDYYEFVDDKIGTLNKCMEFIYSNSEATK